MTTTTPVCTDAYEASDVSSDHAVELFKAWLKTTGHEWVEAHVGRYNGLTLIAKNHTTSLHFRSALCGYGGSGPRASIDILELAGFGPRVNLESIIHGNMSCQFSK